MKFRWFVLLPAAVLLLLASAYLLLTSSFFGVSILLPVICRSTGLQLVAREVNWSPIRGTFELQGMCLGPVGEPFLLAERAAGEIRLRRLLQRQINVPLIELEGAELSFCRDARNRWNFTRLIENAATMPNPPRNIAETAVRKPDKPFLLDLERVTVRRSRIVATDHTPDRGGRLEIGNFEADAENYGNGRKSKIRANGDLQLVSGRELAISGKLGIQIQLESGDDLSLHQLDMTSALAQISGKIADRPLAAATVEGDVSLAYAGQNGWELRKFTLRQKLSDTIRSRISADGMINTDPFLCDLNLSAQISDELTAALSDCFRGINPGQLRLAGEGHVTASRENLKTSGTLSIIRSEGEAQFGRERLMLPGFELRLRHLFSADLVNHSFKISELQADVLGNQRSLASITLNQPLAYNTEKSRIESSNASLSIQIDALPLPLLRLAVSDPAFTPTAGMLKGGLSLSLTPDGLPEVSGAIDLTDAAFRSGSWTLDQLALHSETHCLLNRDGSFVFDRLNLQASRNGVELGKISGTATVTPVTGSGSCQVKLENVSDAWLPLLPPSCRPMVEKLPPALLPATLSGSADLRFGPDFKICENLRLRLDAAAGTVLEAEMPRQHFSAKGIEDNWKFTIRTTTSADALRQLFPAFDILTRGQIITETRVQAANQFQTIGIETGIDLKSGGIAFPERANANLDLHSDLTLYLPPNGRLQLNNFDTALRIDGNPALRISGSGYYAGSEDRAEGTLRIRYLNDAFLDTVLPGRLTDGLIAGELRAEAAPKSGTLLLTGNFSMDKFRTPGSTRPFSGKGQFRLERDNARTTLSDCVLTLADSIKQLASVRLAAEIPAAPEQQATLRIAADSADLWTMYENAAPATAAQPENRSIFSPPREQQSQRVPFHFGNRPLLLDLDLQKLRWKSGTFALQSQILLHRNQARTTAPAHLFINDADLVFDLAMEDRATGMSLQTKAKAASPIAIAPLMELFEDAPDCTGTISDFTWDLSFDRLLSAAWYTNFRGTASGTVNDLKLTYTEANTPLTRLLLLPVELLVRAGTLVPNTLEVKNNWEKLLQTANNFTESPLSEITFQTGLIELAAEQDLLRIRKLNFQGDPVQKLDFSGTMVLTQPHEVDLNTAIEVGTLAVKIPIQGTLAAPKTSNTSVLRSISSASLEVLLNRLGGEKTDQKENSEPQTPFIRLLRDLTGFEQK